MDESEGPSNFHGLVGRAMPDAVPDRITPSNQLERVLKSITVVSESIAHLEARLNLVIGPESEGALARETMPPHTGSELAARLEEIEMRTLNLDDRLRCIAERITL